MIRHDRVLACRGLLDTEIGAGGRPCEDAGEPQAVSHSPAEPALPTLHLGLGASRAVCASSPSMTAFLKNLTHAL